MLRQALAEAEGGHGRAVVLAGEAGVGKSRLVSGVVADAAARGVPVLAGRAVQAASPVPFRPLAEALFSYLRHGQARDRLEDPFRSVLARLLPGWTVEPTGTGEVAVVLGEAVLRLLINVGGSSGCVLALEDLHWADRETIAVVEYLADNLAEAPVLLIVTVRDDEPGEQLHRLGSLTDRRSVARVDVRRLDAADALAMAAACLATDVVPASLRDTVTQGAEGLPFLVEELLTAAVDTGGSAFAAPASFAETVRRRLRAAAGSVDVLRPAALLGRTFDADLLVPITHLPLDEVAARLRRAVEHRIVEVESAGRFRFRHAMTRAAILADLLPPERTALAGQALAAVESAHPGLPGLWCELAAELAEQAAQPDRAAGLFLEAGRRCVGQGALVTAQACLDRARTLAGDNRAQAVEVDEALCAVLALAGNNARLATVGDRLLSGLAAVGAPATRVTAAHLGLARAAVTAADWPTAERHLGRAGGRDAEAGVLAAEVALGRGAADRAARLARRALADAERAGRPELACEALEVIGRRERTRDLRAAEHAFASALDRARAHELTVWRVRALHELGTVDLLSGGPIDRLVEARAAAYAAGAVSTAATVGLQLAAWHLNHAQVERAVAAARECAAEAQRLRMPLVAALGGVVEAAAHALAGRGTAMDAAVAAAFDRAGDDPEVRGVAALQARAAYWLVREDRARATAELDAGMQLLQGTPVTAPFRGMWALVHALEDLDGEAAVAEVERSGLTVYWLVRGWVGHARSVSLGRAGRRADADAAYAEADATLAACSWYQQHARRLVAEAALADGWGDPQAWLTEALGFFDARDYDRIGSACRALLRRAGVPVPRRRRATSDVPAPLHGYGLTARETEVLTLLGEARPTREIAAELFVSPKTVERHIANLAAKVGLRGRAELIAFAARHASPGE